MSLNESQEKMVVEVINHRSSSSSSSCVAAIFGVTGLVGKELARKLLSTPDWKVYGVARRPDTTSTMQSPDQYHFLSCDLLNPLETHERLLGLEDVTHIFWVTWASNFPLESVECYEENKAMLANVLNVLLPKAKALKHISLQTGTKHYVSFQGNPNNLVYEEESPRAPMVRNFYYALEDLLQERLSRNEVGWSVHRPGLIMGCSSRTFYNFIGTICVYGAICKHLDLPFVFGGNKLCWEEMVLDTSDACLIAEQHIWIAGDEGNKYKGQAFNAINGENYTWKEIWPSIGAKFGVTSYNFSEQFIYSSVMNGKKGVWDEIVAKEGLVRTEIGDLANWVMLDELFRIPFKILVSRNKVDSMGFQTKYKVLDSILYWIDVMRADKLIPCDGISNQ